MSAKLLGLVFESDLPRPEKFVLLALADHSKDNGSDCYPSLRLVAWKTGYSERQIQEVMASLENQKVLRVIHRGGSGRGDHNEYKIEVVNLKPLPPLPEETSYHTTAEVRENRVLSDRKVRKKAQISTKKSANKYAKTSVEYKNINLKEYIVAAETESQAFELTADSRERFFLHPKIPIEPWCAFEEMRNSMRKPMTDAARRLLQRKLINLAIDGYSPQELLETATLRCWLDVYPPVKNTNGTHVSNGSNGSGTPDAYAEEMARRAAKKAVITQGE